MNLQGCEGGECGFCAPGYIMTAMEILETKKDYTREELKKLLSGHLCRCTGCENILNAVTSAVGRRKEAKGA
ncbi:MAG: hypothetical protein LBT31_07110 [Synergistaceae bacterium]|nr:hypothetical protein [Synergistaceae bacterium]